MKIDSRLCKHCNTSFDPANKYQVFCAEKCRSAHGYVKSKAKKKKEQEDTKEGMFRIEDYGKNMII